MKLPPVYIGKFVRQSEGWNAFVPDVFPPSDGISVTPDLGIKHAEAMRLLGKLDGITQLLPDKDFFLFMFVRKDAASSSQIEGTGATMIDAIESEIMPRSELPEDVDDIVRYIKALNYGIKRLEKIPISQRLICEIHRELMDGARATHHPYPGEFRKTQNWIGGTSPTNARFIPPPVHEIPRTIGDLEKFIHAKSDHFLPLIKAALMHAQFETFHPFTDGNGRTGRMLITLFLWQEKLLELPVLYLSAFLKKHQQLYYDRLLAYHSVPSDPGAWIDFFLDGVIETAGSAIETSRQITHIRERDMEKIQTLGTVAAESAMVVLRNLYRLPIVDVAKVQEWTGFRTRRGAQKVIDRFIRLGILVQRNPRKTYGRTYEYRSYLNMFEKQ